MRSCGRVSLGMKFGVTIFPTEDAIHPVELGKRLEERGFESLFVPEHTHIPTSRRTPFPGGGKLPREYARTYDPFVTLTAVAAATDKLVLATGVCLLTERDPIVTAKQVASLDHFSGGRFVFGVGAGWNEEEMQNHGTDPRQRWKVLRERVEAMKAIWTQERARYNGDHVRIEELWQWPKPLQSPHPPVYLGASTEAALPRVVRYADGWLPSGLRGIRDFAPYIRKLEAMCEEAGRPLPPVSVYGAEASEEAVRIHADAGIERVIFRLPSAPADEVTPLLERYAELMHRFA